MNTPTPRTDAVYLQRGNWANEEELRDLARKLETDLATERARLDWVFRNCKVFAADYTITIHDREDVGVAMKEGAK